MDLFIHRAEKGKRGGKNENVKRGGAAQQQQQDAFLRCRKRGGRPGIEVVTPFSIMSRGQIKARPAKHKPAPQRYSRQADPNSCRSIHSACSRISVNSSGVSTMGFAFMLLAFAALATRSGKCSR